MRWLAAALLVACTRTGPRAVGSADEVVWPRDDRAPPGLFVAEPIEEVPPSVAYGAVAPTGPALAVPGARWAAFCQARVDSDGNGRLFAREDGSGDVLGPFFATEDAPTGVPGRVLGWDDTARWVVLEEPSARGERVTLIDAEHGGRMVLAEDAPRSDLDVVAFAGAWLFIVRGDAEHPSSVRALVDLETLEVRHVDAGPGRLVQAGLSEDGRFLWLASVPTDAPGPGPRPSVDAWHRESDRPLAPFPEPPFGLARPRRSPACWLRSVWACVDADEPLPARSMILRTSNPFPEPLTVAEVEALTATRRFTGDGCRGVVLARDPEGPGRLVACERADAPSPMLAYARDAYLRPIDVRSFWMRPEARLESVQVSRLVRVDASSMLDLRTGALRTHDGPVGASHDRWYLRADASGSLWREDADRPDAPRLVAHRLRNPEPLFHTPHLPSGWALMKVPGGVVGVDLAAGYAAFLGRDPVGVREPGHVLVRDDENRTLEDLRLGPRRRPLPVGRLRWQRVQTWRSQDARRANRRPW
ncbi:MAG: hypothetical protein AAGH15_01180 [Myxococcota bacterium]